MRRMSVRLNDYEGKMTTRVIFEPGDKGKLRVRMYLRV